MESYLSLVKSIFQHSYPFSTKRNGLRQRKLKDKKIANEIHALDGGFNARDGFDFK